MFKKITLITSVYNRADLMEETINSILSQNYPNLEYIVIDDNSADNTAAVVKKYEKHLTYYKNDHNLGLYKNLNKGYAKSSGEIMGWLNSDDLLHPGCLSIVNEIFSTNDKIEWITGIPNTRDARGRIPSVSAAPVWNKEIFYYGKMRSIQQESTFWRRSLWEKSGGKISEEYPLAADHELWMRFFLYADLYVVTALLGSFRNHGKQMSIEKQAQYRAEIAAMREKYAAKIKNAGRLAFLAKDFIYQALPHRLSASRRIQKKLFNNKIINYNFNNNKFEIV
ncbi:MAG: glycosyltransferase family 2 protein [Patescibacteria group bacterium]|nr:glycosyltransferase family 2 protein [Patescibacteria group bacterium]